jgi:hypothetical protein
MCRLRVLCYLRQEMPYDLNRKNSRRVVGRKDPSVVQCCGERC